MVLLLGSRESRRDHLHVPSSRRRSRNHECQSEALVNPPEWLLQRNHCSQESRCQPRRFSCCKWKESHTDWNYAFLEFLPALNCDAFVELFESRLLLIHSIRSTPVNLFYDPRWIGDWMDEWNGISQTSAGSDKRRHCGYFATTSRPSSSSYPCFKYKYRELGTIELTRSWVLIEDVETHDWKMENRSDAVNHFFLSLLSQLMTLFFSVDRERRTALGISLPPENAG